MASFSAKILAFDTATEACSAALWVDGVIVAERFELAPRRHAALLLPMLEAALAEAGLAVAELDALAFGRGPGAFTGLRIAAAVAQGIAFAAELPVVPISTLATLAWQTMQQQGARQVAVALDARMNEVYWAQYQADATDGVRLLGQECVSPPESVPVAGDFAVWVGVGSGWSVHGEALKQRLRVQDCQPECYPQAAALAALAAHAFRRGEAVSAEQALPVYLRDQVTTTPSRKAQVSA